MNTVELVVPISRDRLADLICCGMESGIWYWAKIMDYTEPDKAIGLETYFENKTWASEVYRHIQYPLMYGGEVILQDTEANKKYILDFKKVKSGLFTMLVKYPRHFGNFLAEEEDSVTGDVFIQCCLFGEIKYG